MRVAAQAGLSLPTPCMHLAPAWQHACVVAHGWVAGLGCAQVAWSPSGEVLASASYDNSIKLWSSDGDEWACTHTLGGERQNSKGAGGRG